jgi:hypothetical protein
LDPSNKYFPSSKIFVHLQTCRSCHQEWSNSIPLNSEKSTTELNGPHFTDWKTSNLTLDLEIQQHVLSLKHVINIIIWIRDTRCYKDIQHKLDHSSHYTVLSPPCDACGSLEVKLFHGTKENTEL